MFEIRPPQHSADPFLIIVLPGELKVDPGDRSVVKELNFHTVIPVFEVD
jgi:hypothetical protein